MKFQNDSYDACNIFIKDLYFVAIIFHIFVFRRIYIFPAGSKEFDKLSKIVIQIAEILCDSKWITGEH